VALQERSQGKARPHVPYRNSMMTSVLRDSLGGNCRTVMIATVNTAPEQLEETISTCRFAQRVAQISNQVYVNEELDPVLVIRRLKQEIRDLKVGRWGLGFRVGRGLGLGCWLWVVGSGLSSGPLGFGILGFGVWGLGFGVWGLGFWVWGLGFGVWGLRFGVWGLGFGVWGFGCGLWTLGLQLGYRNSDSGLGISVRSGHWASQRKLSSSRQCNAKV
jgi:hypothetical protein